MRRQHGIKRRKTQTALHWEGKAQKESGRHNIGDAKCVEMQCRRTREKFKPRRVNTWNGQGQRLRLRHADV